MAIKFIQSPGAAYIGVALAIVLLAPYAGCHLLLTKRPDPVSSDATTSNQSTRESNSEDTNDKIRDDLPKKQGRPRSQEGSNRDSLADIEQLLGKR